jgi:hypothetical protein
MWTVEYVRLLHISGIQSGRDPPLRSSREQCKAGDRTILGGERQGGPCILFPVVFTPPPPLKPWMKHPSATYCRQCLAPCVISPFLTYTISRARACLFI